MRVPYFPKFLHAIAGLLLLAPAWGQTLYDFGNPSSEEQLYLELINRARADPHAEGVRLAATTDPAILAAYTQFGVDLKLMQREFDKIAVTPPLAPNAKLTSAARSHSSWMLNNATQSHDETNPSNTPFSRITATGYNYSVAGENIYAYATTVPYGHAGFEVDWGTGTGGMQDGRGHRANIHNSSYREIGVGVVLGSNGQVGPQLVTQDFATQFGSPALATGVAYYDLNGNGFYDIGEGISGLTVNVSGASYYCMTAAGGGWTVPVPGVSASRTVSFTGLGMNQNVGLTVSGDVNAKADLKLSYTPPVITSASEVSAGGSHTVQFTLVGGAASYRCSVLGSASASPENCENDTGITKSTTGTYAVVQTAVKKEGTAAFHLMNSTGSSQWIELNSLYAADASASLAFQSRVGAATTSEHFKVQVKEEGSASWQSLYDQAGTNGWGESSFTSRSVNLSTMSGKRFRVRFLLDFPAGGSYFSNTTSEFGWYIDAIAFTGVSSLQVVASGTVTGSSWAFTPSAGNYQISVTPVISSRDFPGTSQNLTVTAVTQVPPSFATWASNLETANGLAAGILSDPVGDYDKDGRSNLIEYAFGGSPVSPNDPVNRLPSTRVSGSNLVLSYQVDTSLGDIVVVPQACPTMSSWKNPGAAGAPFGFSDQVISTNGNLQTHEASIPINGSGCFLRISVTRL